MPSKSKKQSTPRQGRKPYESYDLITSRGRVYCSITRASEFTGRTVADLLKAIKSKKLKSIYQGQYVALPDIWGL